MLPRLLAFVAGPVLILASINVMAASDLSIYLADQNQDGFMDYVVWLGPDRALARDDVVVPWADNDALGNAAKYRASGDSYMLISNGEYGFTRTVLVGVAEPESPWVLDPSSSAVEIDKDSDGNTDGYIIYRGEAEETLLLQFDSISASVNLENVSSLIDGLKIEDKDSVTSIESLDYNNDGNVDNIVHLSDGSSTVVISDSQGNIVPAQPAPPLSMEVATNPIGLISGGGSVSHSGVYNYEIPIMVPKGVNGMTPSVSLTYSSQGGEGLAGHGWNVAVTGAVTRCNKSYFYDGTSDVPQGSSSDKLCLNGKRLFFHSSTTAPSRASQGAIFFKSVDDQTRATSLLSAYGGGFKVEAKSGNISYYGVSLAGRIYKKPSSTSTSDIRLWLNEYVEDRFGNRIEYTYLPESNQDAIPYISEILYSDNVIKFNYDDNSDAFPSYVNGMRHLQSKILRSIEVYHSDDLMYRYTLSHDYLSNVSGRSLLKSISQCAYGESETQESCLPITSFDWEGVDASQYQFASSFGDQWGYLWHTEALDWNNDGLEDVFMYGGDSLVRQSNSKYSGFGMRVLVSRPDGSASVVELSAQDAVYKSAPSGQAIYQVPVKPFVHDVNKDGMDDIVFLTQEKQVNLDSANYSCNAQPYGYDTYTVSAYISGMGRVDLSEPFAVENKYSLGKCAEFSLLNLGNHDGWGATASISAADLNGDGIEELIVPYLDANEAQPSYKWKTFYRSNQDLFYSSVGLGFALGEEGAGGATTLGAHRMGASDLDGNGKDDLIFYVNNPYVGDGSEASFYSIFPSIPLSSSYSAATAISRSVRVTVNGISLIVNAGASMLADVNGDGLLDIVTGGDVDGDGVLEKPDGGFVFINQSERGSYVFSWLGEVDYDVSSIFSTLRERRGNDSYYARTFDYNGDGLTDIIFPNPSGSSYPGFIALLSDGVNLKESKSISVRRESNLISSCCSITVPMPESEKIEVSVMNLFSRWVMADTNGDGFKDILQANSALPSTTGIIPGASPVSDGDWLASKTLLFAGSGPGDRISKINRGLGITERIEFAPITDASVYSGDRTSPVSSEYDSFPYIHKMFPRYVVRETESSAAGGGKKSAEFSYAGMKYHLQGLGGLGFSERISTELNVGYEGEGIDRVTAIQVRQDFPFIGAVSDKKVRLSTGAALESKLVEYSSISQPQDNESSIVGRLTPVIVAKYEKKYMPGSDMQPGKVMLATSELMQYDQYANILRHEISYGSKTDRLNRITNPTKKIVTTATYDNDSNLWLLGFATKLNTEFSMLNADSKYYSIWNENYPGTIKVKKSTDSLGLIKDVSYTSTGEVSSVSLRGKNGEQPRVSHMRDYHGGLPSRSVNAMGHESLVAYDYRFSKPLSKKDSNGRVSYYKYDNFGQKVVEQSQSGAKVFTTYQACDFECSYAYSIAIEGDALPRVESKYDSFGNILSKSKVLPDGSEFVSEYDYDKHGNVIRSRETGRSVEASNRYDALGRLRYSKNYDGSEHFIEYHPRLEGGYVKIDTNTIVNGDVPSVSSYSVFDELGRVVEKRDAYASDDEVKTTYSYDASDNVVSTIVHGEILSEVVTLYDVSGKRRVRLDDPDSGIREYGYNAYGEAIYQKDAKGQVIEFDYDRLGRVLSQTGAVIDSIWEYDRSENAIGSLTRMYDGSGDFSEEYYLNEKGLKSRVETTIGLNQYEFTYQYDQYGREKDVSYPSGFEVSYVYDDNGYQSAIDRIDEGNEARLWQAISYDERGRPSEELLGNGVSVEYGYEENTDRVSDKFFRLGSTLLSRQAYNWDTMGNLQSRETEYTGNPGQAEEFSYDSLFRLVASAGGSPTSNAAYTYFPSGNIRTNSAFSGEYQYQSAQPHAVTTAGGNSYSYDDNGNMVSRNGNEIVYDELDKPVTFYSGSGAQRQELLTYRYAPNRARYKRTEQGKVIEYVSGGIFEVEKDLGTGSVKTRSYVGGFFVLENTASGEAPIYIGRDVLSSVSMILDEQGAVVSAHSFSPLGKSRTADLQAYTGQDNEVNRGFTGHEPIALLGLIDMNGRVYDPEVGRFMSADILVQYPNFSQSYNKYSYVMNNFLGAVDPSGYLKELTDEQLSEYGMDALYPGYVEWVRNQMAGRGQEISLERADTLVDDYLLATIATYAGPEAKKAADLLLSKDYMEDRTDALSSDLTYGPWGFEGKMFVATDIKLVIGAIRGSQQAIDFVPADLANVLGIEGWYGQYSTVKSFAGAVRDYAESGITDANGNVIPHLFSFTGHSLGGGLASLAAITTRSFALTFNPAGIHYFQAGIRDREYARNNVHALIITGEVVNLAQDLVPFLVPDSLGTRTMFARPDNIGIGAAHKIGTFCIVMEVTCQ